MVHFGLCEENRKEGHRTSAEGQRYALLDEAIESVSMLGAKFAADRKKLDELKRRFIEGRFHLAVLGQFKRGKSTLINALLGDDLLPSSVLPLTAIPTFIRSGDFLHIRALKQNGTIKEECAGTSDAEVSVFIKKFVAEEANPGNRLDVSQVDIFHTAPILRGGTVFIDTPGIGSTFKHNTASTLNFLPQCDAAVFLISADPPISEVELNFLRTVRSRIPKLFFILNKVDYLCDRERQESVQFFKKIISEQAGIDEDITIFCVSARQALEAKKFRDRRSLFQSGMPKVEKHLIEFLSNEKTEALWHALSRKSSDVLAKIRMQIHLYLRSLQIPLDDLERHQRIFEGKIKEAEHQRIATNDLLKGDRKRLSEFLENQAEQLRNKARAYLEEILNQALADQADINTIRRTLHKAMPPFFENELHRMAQGFNGRVTEVLKPYQEKAEELIETIRETAAELFEIPYHAPESSDAFEMKKQPYWVTQQDKTFF